MAGIWLLIFVVRNNNNNILHVVVHYSMLFSLSNLCIKNIYFKGIY